MFFMEFATLLPEFTIAGIHFGKDLLFFYISVLTNGRTDMSPEWNKCFCVDQGDNS